MELKSWARTMNLFWPTRNILSSYGNHKWENLFEERWHFVLRSWGHSWGMAGLKWRKGWIPLSPPKPDSLLQPYESKRELTDMGTLASETIPPKAIAVLHKCSDGAQGAVLILWTKPEWFREARKRPKEWQKYYWWKVRPGGKPILNAFASSKTVILLGSLLSCSNGILSFFRCRCLVAGQGEQQLPSTSARLWVRLKSVSIRVRTAVVERSTHHSCLCWMRERAGSRAAASLDAPACGFQCFSLIASSKTPVISRVMDASLNNT